MSELTIQMAYTLEQVAATIVDLVEGQLIAAGLHPSNPPSPSVTIYVRAAMASWIELNYQAVIDAPEVKNLFKIPVLKEIKVRYYEIPRRDNPNTYPSVTISKPNV